jgi:TusE/DsrC/DsvC family sulfur relay protein
VGRLTSLSPRESTNRLPARLGTPANRLTEPPSGSTLTLYRARDRIGFSAARVAASGTVLPMAAAPQRRPIIHSQEVTIVAQSMGEIMNPGSVLRDAEFPDAPDDWTREQAVAAAQADAVTLSDDHWDMIKALQDYFARHEKPNVRDLHDALEEAFHSRGGLKYLFGIFPGGPVAQGCRFAGLQAPSGAVDKSFGSVQ